MKWTVTKEFSFEAAHSLPHLPASHKCSRVHGHSYRVIVAVTGEAKEGMVIDYADISKAVDPVIAKLDHRNLNDILTMPTTAENLAWWLWDKLSKALPGLDWVQVNETEKTTVRFRWERTKEHNHHPHWSEARGDNP